MAKSKVEVLRTRLHESQKNPTIQEILTGEIGTDKAGAGSAEPGEFAHIKFESESSFDSQNDSVQQFSNPQCQFSNPVEQLIDPGVANTVFDTNPENEGSPQGGPPHSRPTSQQSLA